MYAVIKTGGKQYRVSKGDVIEVEHLKLKSETTSLVPVLVVDDEGKAIHGAKDLAQFKVGVKVVGEAKGDKLTVFKYRSKTGYASKTGHRQLYSLIEITSIGSDAEDSGAEAKAGRAPESKLSEAPKAEKPTDEAPAAEVSDETPKAEQAPDEAPKAEQASDGGASSGSGESEAGNLVSDGS
jgi:large subunit ribosomal protein L21